MWEPHTLPHKRQEIPGKATGSLLNLLLTLSYCVLPVHGCKALNAILNSPFPLHIYDHRTRGWICNIISKNTLSTTLNLLCVPAIPFPK